MPRRSKRIRTATQSGGTFGNLPRSIVVHVLKNFDIHEVARLQRFVCREFRDAGQDVLGDFAAGAGYTILIYAKNTDCVVAETGEAGTIDCKNGGVATGVTGDCGCTCTDGGGYSGIT